ncbi:MAG: hypothetical protein LBT89_02090 [Planctomycetaceae bacterium]|nr:hypothetical protein [Planctomycetaceae bacterium]
MRRVILIAAFILGWFAANAVFADTIVVKTKSSSFAALKERRELRQAAYAAARADYWQTKAAVTAATLEKRLTAKPKIEIKIEK